MIIILLAIVLGWLIVMAVVLGLLDIGTSGATPHSQNREWS